MSYIQRPVIFACDFSCMAGCHIVKGWALFRDGIIFWIYLLTHSITLLHIIVPLYSLWGIELARNLEEMLVILLAVQACQGLYY